MLLKECYKDVQFHYLSFEISCRFVSNILHMARRLTKGPDKKIFGVCSGLGEYFDIDPTIVRVIFVFGFLVFGSGLLLYLILAIAMPDQSTAWAGNALTFFLPHSWKDCCIKISNLNYWFQKKCLPKSGAKHKGRIAWRSDVKRRKQTDGDL